MLLRELRDLFALDQCANTACPAIVVPVEPLTNAGEIVVNLLRAMELRSEVLITYQFRR
jgi:hypothetical protein